MIAVDYVLLSIFGVSAIIGVFRGFVKEAISLIGWIAAIWGAWQYGANVSAWLPDFVDDATVKIWAARLLVLIGVLLMSGLISRLVSFLIDKTGLSGTDRSAGTATWADVSAAPTVTSGVVGLAKIRCCTSPVRPPSGAVRSRGPRVPPFS